MTKVPNTDYAGFTTVLADGRWRAVIARPSGRVYVENDDTGEAWSLDSCSTRLTRLEYAQTVAYKLMHGEAYQCPLTVITCALALHFDGDDDALGRAIRHVGFGAVGR